MKTTDAMTIGFDDDTYLDEQRQAFGCTYYFDLMPIYGEVTEYDTPRGPVRRNTIVDFDFILGALFAYDKDGGEAFEDDADETSLYMHRTKEEILAELNGGV